MLTSPRAPISSFSSTRSSVDNLCMASRAVRMLKLEHTIALWRNQHDSRATGQPISPAVKAARRTKMTRRASRVTSKRSRLKVTAPGIILTWWNRKESTCASHQHLNPKNRRILAQDISIKRSWTSRFNPSWKLSKIKLDTDLIVKVIFPRWDETLKMLLLPSIVKKGKSCLKVVRRMT